MSLRPDILSVPIYEPGLPIEEIERRYRIRNIIKLASNENPLGPSPKALSIISRSLKYLNRYPDGSGFYLKKDLARRFRIKTSNIILGNGTNEILHMIALAFVRKGEEVIFGSPSFVVYEMEGIISGAKIKKVALKDFRYDLEKISSSVNRRTSVIFIANPNNPTGTFVTGREVETFMKSIPGRVLVVFDEAYAEYAPQDIFPDSLRYAREGRNVIILRTFSKIYGLAGLRIGYGMAKESVICCLEHVRQPFNTNTLAQKAALAALDDSMHLKKSFRLNRQGLSCLMRAFEELGLDYVPSGANFILVRIGKGAMELFKKLLREGIITRPLRGALSEYMRITVGTPEENAVFIRKLKEFQRGEGCQRRLNVRV